jgi:hypothetical protein
LDGVYVSEKGRQDWLRSDFRVISSNTIH